MILFCCDKSVIFVLIFKELYVQMRKNGSLHELMR